MARYTANITDSNMKTENKNSKMRGVIIAGGAGTRLRPLTYAINKQFMPVYDRPLIYYPLDVLLSLGIQDILIISGVEHADQFMTLLGSGKNFGVRFTYRVQDEPKGIAQALSLAEDFAQGGKVAAILGDNIYEDLDSIKKAGVQFAEQEKGAMVFLKKVKDPERFGVAEIKDKKIIKIVEKPKKPKSDLAVTGLYFYDEKVFDIIRDLKPSDRGEYEVTDVNAKYVADKAMSYQIIKGEWIDAGTFDSLLKAGNLMAKKAQK